MFLYKAGSNKETIMPVLGHPQGMLDLIVITKEELSRFDTEGNKQRLQMHIDSQFKPLFRTWPKVTMVNGNMVICEDK